MDAAVSGCLKGWGGLLGQGIGQDRLYQPLERQRFDKALVGAALIWRASSISALSLGMSLLAAAQESSTTSTRWPRSRWPRHSIGSEQLVT